MIEATSPKELEFFRELPPQFVGRLEALGQHASFERDELIFREGEPSSSLYVILSGSVSLEVTTQGRTLRILTVDQGEEFGWSSLVPSHTKHFQARALGRVHVLVFDAAQVIRVCEEEPAFGYALMKRLLGVVSDRFHAVRVQLLDLYSGREK